MKYLVTFPPGGLGHFLSRVLSNTYDFRASPRGSYHELEKIYTSLTTDQHCWAVQSLPIEVGNVVCAHNFDNRDIAKHYPEHYWIDIQINGLEHIYLNNFYRKSIQTNQAVDKKYIGETIKKFPGHDHPLREEFFFMFQYLKQGKLPWISQQKNVHVFEFSSFYDRGQFVDAVTNLPGIGSADYGSVWDDFISKQAGIVNRCQQYQSICDAVKNQTAVSIPDYFDDVDYGIMCAMIYMDTGQDLLNLQNKNWI